MQLQLHYSLKGNRKLTKGVNAMAKTLLLVNHAIVTVKILAVKYL